VTQGNTPPDQRAKGGNGRFSGPFFIPGQFIDVNTRVMVPAPRLRFVSVLYCRYRASLHTGKAELTRIVPDRLFSAMDMFSAGYTRAQVPHPVQVSSV